MTEQEWSDGTSLGDLFGELHGTAGDRKLRLFACACCRRVWHLLARDSRQIVETSERFADGMASRAELEAVRATAGTRPERRLPGGRMSARTAAARAAVGQAWAGARAAARSVRAAVPASGRPEMKAQCDLLRDIFGNPFRAPLTLDVAWLRWNDGTVPRIAWGIYEERAFDRLPILADALLDAGCDDEELLTHLRAPGPHVRGCWALDPILGKS